MKRDNDISAFLGHVDVREELALGPAVGVMALHGGLEFSTSRLARAVASEAPASFYGVIQSSNLGWHVPSIHFNRDVTEHLGTFLDHVRFVISLHGFHRLNLLDTILLGGSHRERAEQLGARLRDRGYRVESNVHDIPPGLRGMSESNPVNLPTEGGIQVELPRLLRRPKPLSGIVASIAETLSDANR